MFTQTSPPTDPVVTDKWKSYICFKLISGARTRLDEELSATSFRISYTEGSVKPDNFEKPFKFFLKKAAAIRASQENTKIISLTWKEVEVRTDKGLLLESIETKKTMLIDTVITDTIDRGFESKSLEIATIEALPSVSI